MSERRTNEYNDGGKTVDNCVYNTDGSETHERKEWNSENELITNERYKRYHDENGNPIKDETTTLDENGRDVQTLINLNNEEGLTVQTTTIEYRYYGDEKKTTHMVVYNSQEGSQTDKWYYYNENGAYLGRKEEHSENGQPVVTYYDANNKETNDPSFADGSQNYNGDGTEKTEPSEQTPPITTNSLKKATAGVIPQMTHNLELDPLTSTSPVQEQSDVPKTVTDGTEILNGAPSAANTTQQTDNVPAANTTQQTDNIPAANMTQQASSVPTEVTPQLNYTPYDAPVTMKTTTGGVNVRKSPDSSSDLVDQKVKDETVKVIGVTDDGWYVLENNGYVKADYLKTVTITEYETPMTLNVSADKVFIRKGPGKSFDSQDQVNTGTTVSVVSYSDDGWYKLSNGGYISAEFVTDQPLSTGGSSGGSITGKTDTASTAGSNITEVVMFETSMKLKVSAETAEIYAGPASGYDLVETLPKGTKLTAVGRLADWYLIDLDKYHFVHADLVELDVYVEAETNNNTELVEETGTLNNENVTNVNEPLENENQPQNNEPPLENNTATPSEATPAA